MACATTWPRQRLSHVYLRYWAACLLIATPLSVTTCADAYEMVSIRATRPAGASAAQLQAELFKPKGDGPFPAVVLMHGCGGWQSAVLSGLHAHTQFFLDHGYAVLNLDSFGTRGTSGGSVCETFARLERARDYRTYDAFDALRYLRTLPYVDKDNIFLMGQSNGGSVAINAAKSQRHDGYRAVAAYYPWCGTLGASTVKLSAALIVFSGGRDDWVPATECQHRRAVGASLKVVEYPTAAHSFDLPIGQQRYLGKLIGYDRPATIDSRAQMLAFFDSHQVKPVVTTPIIAKTPAAAATQLTASFNALEGADLSWFE